MYVDQNTFWRTRIIMGKEVLGRLQWLSDEKPRSQGFSLKCGRGGNHVPNQRCPFYFAGTNFAIVQECMFFFSLLVSNFCDLREVAGVIEITTFLIKLQSTSETICREVEHSNPVIGVTLSQLLWALVWNCRCSSQWSTFRRSFLVNLLYLWTFCFSFHRFVSEQERRFKWMAATI